jgi:RES domain-containing protein
MLVYRISHHKFIKDLSGYGAWEKGGRWNSPGKYVVYTSGSMSLAAWEVFSNLPKEFLPAKAALSAATIFIPGDLSTNEIQTKNLPRKWFGIPHPKVLREIGDRWIDRRESLLLKVPSAIVRTEYNFLINPLHADFPKIKIQSIRPFEFDPRVLK